MAKQKEESQDDSKGSGLSSDPKIEAVKQLIFGENMQQYDSEFSEVRATIKKTKQELVNEIDETRDALTNLINETREALTKAVSDLRSDTNKKVSQLREDMDESIADLDDRKLNRKLLGALLQEMGKQIAE
ncbi:MAG: hypothetical protein Roseis2KO_25480 [Roseivirga sp.]